MDAVRTKSQMYELLASGAFGNTIRQFFSVDEWLAHPDSQRYLGWAVRSLVVGGPCRLNCPREEVAATVERFACPINISMMVDAVCRVTLWADVWDSPTGLMAHGIEYPPVGGSWRALMPVQAKPWEGVAARMLLRKHLNENSLDDLYAVFEKYPGHVVELSACDRCIGVMPGRNGVVWEVRDGTYGY